MRIAVPIMIVALAAALLGGCGGSAAESSTATQQDGAPSAPIGASARNCETLAVDAEGLRATGLSCEQARRVMYGWQRDSRCAAAGEASRGACTTRSYRCIGAMTGRGVTVSCARPGRSIAFTVPRG
jgi:hypothetical protein